jgi:hypothetical protein
MTEGVSYATVDSLAREYNDKLFASTFADEELAAIRKLIIARVKEEGSYPPRATKTRVLAGEEFELRVTEPTEVSVDSKVALRIREACARSGARNLFGKLFRRVETFVLAGDAQKTLNAALPASAPRGLRALFARAISVKDLSPSVEVKRRKKNEAAA